MKKRVSQCSDHCTHDEVVMVKVTAKHIKRGVPCDPMRCPISLALAETVIPRFSSNVTTSTLEVFDPVGEQCLAIRPLPRTAQAFVRKFDACVGVRREARKSVRPFTFSVGLPANSLRRKAR